MDNKTLIQVEYLDRYLQEYIDGANLDVHPYEVADLLLSLKSSDETIYIDFLKKIPQNLLASVIIELPKAEQEEIYQRFGPKKLALLTENLNTNDAAELISHIEEIDKNKANAILSNLSQEDRGTIEEIISYSNSEAGSHMQVDIFKAYLDEKIGESILRLKRMKKDNEIDNVSHVFIISNENKFIGMIPLEDLILHGPKELYRDVVSDEGKITLSVLPKDDIKKVVEISSNYDLSVIPVVDTKGTLVGRITSDDIYDIISKEATGQIYNLAGVSDKAEERENFWVIGKSRAVWLGVNLFTAIMASLVIGLFDATIQSLVALAILMPIVASMGGNAGTQTLTVTVRQMALGEIFGDEAKKAVIKEVFLALLNGLLYGVVMGIIAYLWFDMPMLGLVIAMAMLANIFSAGFFGTVIPLSLNRLGIDPAIGSTVLLTTVTDIVGFFSFLGLATLLL